MALAPGTTSAPTRSSPRSARAGWARSTARATRASAATSPSRSSPTHLANDPKALARFESEAKAVAALSHPNILALFDVGEANGVRYAVTELLEGETLRALVARGPVPRQARPRDRRTRSPTASPPPTRRGSSTATSSPRTSSSRRTATSSSSTSASPGTTRLSATRTTPTPPPSSALTEAGAVLGHRRLHVARAGERRARRPPLRPVLARRRPLRDARGKAAVRRRDGRRDADGDHPRGARAALEQKAPPAPAPVRWLVERLPRQGARASGTTRRADLARELTTLEPAPVGRRAGDGRRRSAAEQARRARRLFSVPAPSRPPSPSPVLAVALVTGALVKSSARPPPPSRPPRDPAAGGALPLPIGSSPSPSPRTAGSSSSPRSPGRSRSRKRTRRSSSSGRSTASRPGRSRGPRVGSSPSSRPTGGTSPSPSIRRRGTSLPEAGARRGRAGTTICECDATFGVAWAPDGSILFASMRRAAAEGARHRRHARGGHDARRRRGRGQPPAPPPPPRRADRLYTALRWTTLGMSWKKARIFAQRSGRRRGASSWKGARTAAGCPRGTSSSRGREGSSPRRSTRRPCGSAASRSRPRGGQPLDLDRTRRRGDRRRHARRRGTRAPRLGPRAP